MKRAVAVLLCAVLATGSLTSCQSKKSETAASSSVKEEKETKKNIYKYNCIFLCM